MASKPLTGAHWILRYAQNDKARRRAQRSRPTPTHWLTASRLKLTPYFPSTHEKISGATIVASLSTMNFGVFDPSLPQVIFSFGTAPE